MVPAGLGAQSSCRLESERQSAGSPLVAGPSWQGLAPDPSQAGPQFGSIWKHSGRLGWWVCHLGWMRSTQRRRQQRQGGSRQSAHGGRRRGLRETHCRREEGRLNGGYCAEEIRRGSERRRGGGRWGEKGEWGRDTNAFARSFSHHQRWHRGAGGRCRASYPALPRGVNSRGE